MVVTQRVSTNEHSQTRLELRGNASMVRAQQRKDAAIRDQKLRGSDGSVTAAVTSPVGPRQAAIDMARSSGSARVARGGVKEDCGEAHLCLASSRQCLVKLSLRAN